MIGDILQPTHLLLILVVALLVLGPKRLPEVGRSLGRGLRDFRSAISGEDHHDEVAEQASAPANPAPASEPAAEPAAPAGEPVGVAVSEPVGVAASEPAAEPVSEPSQRTG